MATTQSNTVQVRIVSSDESQAAINQALNNLERFEKKAKGVGLTLNTLFKSYVSFGALNFFKREANEILDFSFKLEQAKAGFTTLLGSATQAEERLRSLTKFAEVTPFDISGVVEVNKMLQSLTEGALATEKGMRLVGDAASATGRPLEEVGMWIGRLYAGLESGTPVGEATLRLVEMGLVSGTTKRELDALATQGALPAAEAMAKLDETFGFATGAMELQAKTLPGLLTQLHEAARIAITQSNAYQAAYDTLKGYAQLIKDFADLKALEADETNRAAAATEAFFDAREKIYQALKDGIYTEKQAAAAQALLNKEREKNRELSNPYVYERFLKKLGLITEETKKQGEVVAETTEKVKDYTDLKISTFDILKQMEDEMLSSEEKRKIKVEELTDALYEQSTELWNMGQIADDTYNNIIEKLGQYYDAQNKVTGPAFESKGMGQFGEEDAYFNGVHEDMYTRMIELDQEYKDNKILSFDEIRQQEVDEHTRRLKEIQELADAHFETNAILEGERERHKNAIKTIADAEATAEGAARDRAARYAQAGFANMASAAASFFGQQSAAFKSFAIGEALINTYRAVNQVWSDPAIQPTWLKFPLAATVLAAGLGNVASIAQAHSGATNIPNEGTYLLNRGERVLAPEQNRDLTDALERGGMGGSTQIVIDGEVLAHTINQMANDGRLTIPARAVA